eukprot:TRINITY_DN27435_c0_g1_i7.p1 TRINITY_DN27435_c0_g1~~TRINITY_DN27435_c0_g1_i7.p1  ORF type:complete len:384 (-),score=33.21 TRINITY_DN27435_c0_g1_i7:697-1848(-)
MQQEDNLGTVLSRTKISDLRRPQSVTVLRSNAAIDLVLRSLATHRILSAPVITVTNENVAHSDENRRGSIDVSLLQFNQSIKTNYQIAGFVDLNIILGAFMKEINAKKVCDMKLLQRMRVLEDMGQSFCKTQLINLNIQNHKSSVILYGSQMDRSLLDHLRQGFVFNEQHPRHRIALVDNTGHFVNIISQTDIMKFLVSLPAFKNQVGCKTLEELELVSKQVVCVPPEVSALEALLIMHNHGVSAVAVTNSLTNKLIGNFSISELRTIMCEHFGALGLPVGEFLALEHGTEYAGYGNFHDEVRQSQGGRFIMGVRANQKPRLGNDVGQNLAVCSPSQTLAEAVEIMLERRIHQIYVVEELGSKLKSVVSYTDVLNAVLTVCGK